MTATASHRSCPTRRSRGQSRWNLKDSDGVTFVREMIEASARGGGFVAYRYPRAGSTEPAPKLSYSVESKASGWTIGSGIYIDDIDAIFRTQVLYVGSAVGGGAGPGHRRVLPAQPQHHASGQHPHDGDARPGRRPAGRRDRTHQATRRAGRNGPRRRGVQGQRRGPYGACSPIRNRRANKRKRASAPH